MTPPDIVDELRVEAAAEKFLGYTARAELYSRAAAEIERLRGALVRIGECEDPDFMCPWGYETTPGPDDAEHAKDCPICIAHAAMTQPPTTESPNA